LTLHLSGAISEILPRAIFKAWHKCATVW
jgi:hypothetical protein